VPPVDSIFSLFFVFASFAWNVFERDHGPPAAQLCSPPLFFILVRRLIVSVVFFLNLPWGFLSAGRVLCRRTFCADVFLSASHLILPSLSHPRWVLLFLPLTSYSGWCGPPSLSTRVFPGSSPRPVGLMSAFSTYFPFL